MAATLDLEGRSRSEINDGADGDADGQRTFGDVATADVTAYAIDTSTGNACPRWGNLVVTPPNGFASHPMSVDMPICGATVTSVE
jgi:hypothetical protein